MKTTVNSGTGAGIVIKSMGIGAIVIVERRLDGEGSGTRSDCWSWPLRRGGEFWSQASEVRLKNRNMTEFHAT